MTTTEASCICGDEDCRLWMEHGYPSQPSPASSTVGEEATKFSREMDQQAWENADAGQHTRENNIRLARANTAGKAKALFQMLAGWSESDFVRAAASDDGENLLAMLVGVLGEFPNPALSPSSGEPASVAVACSRCGNLDMMMCDCSLPSRVSKPTPVEAGLREADALRIAWWNDMRGRGVSQDVAIEKIRAALSETPPSKEGEQ